MDIVTTSTAPGNTAIPRQTVLRGACLGFTAAALAACTTYGKPSESTPDSATPSPGTASPEAGAANAIASVADVPVGSGTIVDDVVLTQPSQGDFRAFSTACTHAGCAVSTIADGTIDCPCHGSKFNLDGTVANGPATRPLEAKTITVQGDSLVLG